jgi:signal transduction histidine kinase
LLLVAAAEHEEAAASKCETDIAPFVAEIEREMRSTTAGRLRVITNGSARRATADPARLRQIVLNLVDNASKYAPDGPIELRASCDGAGVHLAVVDHGPGIPAADRTRVFEQFVQLDQSSTRRQGGTGLGLYLCRQLVTLLNGTLTLEPTPGGGCCFTLTVPPAPAAELSSPEAPEPARTIDTEPAPPRFAGVRTRPAEFARPSVQ